ncbi:MAG: hypothetical protein AB1798_08615 [Spirochaetota bacterium]
MDNDNEVKDLVERSKSVFLREIGERYAKRDFYRLDQEFAKTRKNRSPVVWLSVLIFVSTLAAAAIVLTMYIQGESQKVPIDIADFADVNLKDVLDKARKYENDMKIAQRELQDLNDTMNQEIADITQKADQQIEILKNQNLDKAELDRQTAEIRAKQKNEIEAVRVKYKSLVEKKRQAIAEIQTAMDAYDAKIVAQAKQQEEILNNQQKRFDIQMQDTVNYYETKVKDLENQRKQEVAELKAYHENLTTQLKKNQVDEINRLNEKHADETARLILKYNPVYSSGAMADILGKDVPRGTLDSVALKDYRNVLQQENILDAQGFGRIRSSLSDISVLLKNLKTIPFTNSVPAVLDKLESTETAVIKEYENLWSRTADLLNSRNMAINQYLYALDSLLANSRENGYILDPRDTRNIVVYIYKLHDVKDGDFGYVFREDNEPIGTIKFSVSSGVIKASLAELTSAEKPVKPFDKILIQVK